MWPEKRDVVHAEGVDVDGAWGASCAASRATRAPYVLGEGDDLLDRPQLAGDVRGAGDDDQPRAGGGGRERVAQQRQRVGDAAGDGQAHRAARVPGQQRGVVLGLEDEHGGVAGQAAAEEVERVGGVAGEDDQVLRAGADERADLGAGLLVPARGDLGGVAVAAVDRGVGAQGDVDRRLDRLQRRGAGGVVEVGVVHDRAVQRRHAQVLRHRAGRSWRTGRGPAPVRRAGGHAPARGACGRGCRDGGGGVAVRLVAQRGDRHRGGAPRRSWRTNGSRRVP